MADDTRAPYLVTDGKGDRLEFDNYTDALIQFKKNEMQHVYQLVDFGNGLMRYEQVN